MIYGKVILKAYNRNKHSKIKVFYRLCNLVRYMFEKQSVYYIFTK